MLNNPNSVGSSFDDFLVEEGIAGEVEAGAIKKIIAYQLQEAIEMDKKIPHIDKIIPIIISLASPDQIILFGSYARGDNTEKSDIDLLIVKKGLEKGRDIIGSIYIAFFENKINVPVDLLAIDYNRYIELNNKIGYIYKTIKEQGKVIYNISPRISRIFTDYSGRCSKNPR